MNFKLATALCLVLGFCHQANAETFNLTLVQAVERAMKVNYDISNAQERIAELEAKIGEVRAGALPSLTAGGQYSRNFKRPEMYIQGSVYRIGNKNTYTATATLNQALFAAGKVSKALKAAKSETESTKRTMEDVKDEIRLQVKTLFNEILFFDKNIDITKKTLDQLEKHLKMIKARYDQGLESDYTLMRQEVEVSNVRPELSSAEQNKIVLVNTLKVILAMQDSDELKLAGELKYTEKKEHPSKEVLVSKALESRNDLLATASHIKALKYNVGIEHGGYLPTLNLTSNFMWQGQTDDFKVGKDERFYTVSAALVFSMPIFDGLKTHYRIKEAKSELKIATNEELRLRTNIATDVENALSQLNSARTREATQSKVLTLAQKAVSIASLRFGQGLTSQLELNDTIISRDQSEKLYAQAVYDCLVAEANLERVIGGNK